MRDISTYFHNFSFLNYKFYFHWDTYFLYYNNKGLENGKSHELVNHQSWSFWKKLHFLEVGHQNATASYEPDQNYSKRKRSVLTRKIKKYNFPSPSFTEELEISIFDRGESISFVEKTTKIDLTTRLIFSSQNQNMN